MRLTLRGNTGHRDTTATTATKAVGTMYIGIGTLILIIILILLLT